jgi:hypothetical protein
VEAHQHSPWTTEEEEIILEKYKEVGSKWVLIASFLCGRTGNDVKNRWHKHIGKRFLEQQETERREESPETLTAPPPTRQLSAFLQDALN